MANPSFIPRLYNDCKTLSISFLREHGYLKSEQSQNGTIKWSINGKISGSISIEVNMESENPYLELDYKYNDEPKNYKICLVSIPSNLGKGKILYFLCPITNLRCRKLYLIDGYFLHRQACTNCMYEIQIHAKRYRRFKKYFDAAFQKDEVYEELNSKHFKTHYAGKITKRYRRIILSLKKMERITIEGLLNELP